MQSGKSRALSPAELDDFGNELDALREKHLATRGQHDADYIRKVRAGVRWLTLLGRISLWVGAVAGSTVAPYLLWPLCILGAVLLGLGKILENMELGHNVMHGQFDWMGDPSLQGNSYEWDIAGTSDNWRHTHNYSHHTWTNVRGMDEDIGYGVLRIFPEQRWRPYYLLQPLIAIVFSLYFQWGVAIQNIKLGLWTSGRMSNQEVWRRTKPVLKKSGKQLFKDYILFPALAGPFFLPVILGNLVANSMRNVWTYVIIFCGHFTADAEVFPKNSVKNESRGHWYLRQLRGSSNIRGGKWLDLWSGNLSHQIEHHFFPTVPANRYKAMAVEVREICARYGQHYNTGSLFKQFGEVIWRILRHAFPSKPGPAVVLNSVGYRDEHPTLS